MDFAQIVAALIFAGVVGLLVGVLITVLVYGFVRGRPQRRWVEPPHRMVRIRVPVKPTPPQPLKAKRIPEEWGEPMVKPMMRGW